MNAQRRFVVPSALLILVAAIVFSLSHYKRSNAQQLPRTRTTPLTRVLPPLADRTRSPQRQSAKFVGSRIPLERVTYTLPASLAESLKNLLEDENLTLFECQLESTEDERARLVVTTNPSTQRMVESFLQAIIKTKPNNTSNSPGPGLPSSPSGFSTPTPQSQPPAGSAHIK